MARFPVLAAPLLVCSSVAYSQSWTHFARAPDRVAAVTAPPPSLAARLWTASHDQAGQAITFNGQSGVVAAGSIVYALGRSGGVDRVYAILHDRGEVAWQADIPPPFVGSWSAPALDAANGAVLVAAGSLLSAFDAVSGSPRWTAALDNPVVNASPLVTTDLGPRDRVFITDYDPFGSSGRLTCLNADPHDPVLNPFAPGQRVWTVTLGATSGNTPAYRAGVVYVASITGESGSGPGVLRAFDATAAAAPAPLWTFTNPAGHGFYGGVCVADEPGGACVYAASYAFSGGQDAANLVKVRAEDGAIAWSVPANRTAATPIPLPDGRVLLSSGIAGFGSAPSLQLFLDAGASATRLWDTALDTWSDLNANGVMEVGEYFLVGGWTHQPAAFTTPGGMFVAAGAVPVSSWSSACTDLYLLDLARAPADPAFVVAHALAAGSTPAAEGGNLFTLGAGGLVAYGSSPCYTDCTADGLLTVADFACFQSRFVAGDPYADCNADGSLTIADFACFQTRFVEGCP